MRHAILPIAAWAGLLQVLSVVPSTTDGFMRIIGVASVLGSLTVFVFRLGVWRQEMEHARHNIGEQMTAFRGEMTSSLARIEQRLDRLEGTHPAEILQ